MKTHARIRDGLVEVCELPNVGRLIAPVIDECVRAVLTVASAVSETDKKIDREWDPLFAHMAGVFLDEQAKAEKRADVERNRKLEALARKK